MRYCYCTIMYYSRSSGYFTQFVTFLRGSSFWYNDEAERGSRCGRYYKSSYLFKKLFISSCPFKILLN